MKKTIFQACIFIMLFTACKDKKYFELDRPVQNPWIQLADFDRAPVGAYNNLFAGSNDWGNHFNYWYLYKNAVGDDVDWSTPGDNTWGWYRDTQNNKDWVDQTFLSSYQTIASVNDALKFIDDNGGNPYPKISSDDKTYNLDRMVGELYFIRGFAYYMAATLCCNAYVPGGANDAKQIPLRTTSADSYVSATNPKIGTVEEVWLQILSDFGKADSLLPERYIAGKMFTSYQAGRANKFAAAFMLARTYFAMGNYTKALENASYAIDQNGGDYDLSEDPIEAFNKSTLGRGKEVIMYIPSYDPSFSHQNNMQATYSNLLGANPVAWVATYMDPASLNRIGWMNDDKNDTTINSTARIDKRFQQLIYVREPANVPLSQRIPGHYYETRTNMLWRSMVANKAFRGPGIGFTNIPQLRLAEMYLTRSICSFRAGDKQNAANDLNIVRKRAWDANVAGQSYESSDHFVTANNISEQMINDERLIEMFCEGDRIDYLRGLKVDVGNGDRGPGSVPYTDKGFVWPIPKTETSLDNSYK